MTNVYDGMPRAEVENLLGDIERDISKQGLTDSFQKISQIFEENLIWSEEEKYGYSLTNIYECFADNISTKCAKIEVGRTKDEKRYYVLYFQSLNDENELEWTEQCRCPIVEVDGHDMLSWQFINQIRELAYLGYKFIQAKEWHTIDLD